MVLQLTDDDEAGLEYLHLWALIYALTEPAMVEGSFLLHGALIERAGRGVVLAGPGGMGKTTCWRRVPPPWRGLSDDLVLVCPTGAGEYVAHPMPTCGAFLDGGRGGTWDAQHSILLSGVFFLNQAGVDDATPISGSETALLLTERSIETYRLGLRKAPTDVAREWRVRILDNVSAAARTVPAWDLKFSRGGRFWEAVEGALEPPAEPTHR